MKDILNQLRAADDRGLYYMVLFGTLALPDICGGLETPDIGNGERYRRWYDANVWPTYNVLTAHECWKYRNSILHDGTAQSTEVGATRRIVFIEPVPGKSRPMLNMPNHAPGGGVIGEFEIHPTPGGEPEIKRSIRKELTHTSGDTVVPIDLQLFYLAVSCAADRWLAGVTDPAIQQRIQNMAQRRAGEEFGLTYPVIG